MIYYYLSSIFFLRGYIRNEKDNSAGKTEYSIGDYLINLLACIWTHKVNFIYKKLYLLSQNDQLFFIKLTLCINIVCPQFLY